MIHLSRIFLMFFLGLQRISFENKRCKLLGPEYLFLRQFDSFQFIFPCREYRAAQNRGNAQNSRHHDGRKPRK